MWTTLSVRISVLTLAVVMLFSAPEVDSHIHLQEHCSKDPKGHKLIENIKLCYELKKKGDCKHAFMIETESNMMYYVKPTPPWLKQLINSGSLTCTPEISKKKRKRFEVLNEDDLEQ